MNNGLQQGSVLSLLLFDVFSSGLPSELLYASDLVLMAPTMEQLGRRVAEWRVGLFGKGLKVNSCRSKVMVGSSGWKMIVKSGRPPSGVVVCYCSHSYTYGRKGGDKNVNDILFLQNLLFVCLCTFPLILHIHFACMLCV